MAMPGQPNVSYSPPSAHTIASTHVDSSHLQLEVRKDFRTSLPMYATASSHSATHISFQPTKLHSSFPSPFTHLQPEARKVLVRVHHRFRVGQAPARRDHAVDGWDARLHKAAGEQSSTLVRRGTEHV